MTSGRERKGMGKQMYKFLRDAGGTNFVWTSTSDTVLSNQRKILFVL